nr:MAG TPA: hypothetical protein [Caudoviricetes sp.]
MRKPPARYTQILKNIKKRRNLSWQYTSQVTVSRF